MDLISKSLRVLDSANEWIAICHKQCKWLGVREHGGDIIKAFNEIYEEEESCKSQK